MARHRTKFQVMGEHPLLELVKGHFISQGMEMVDSSVEPAFYLVGAQETDDFTIAEVFPHGPPALILSSDNVYTCLDSALRIRKTERMSEEDALIVPSTLEYSTLSQAKAIYDEAYCKSIFKSKTIIVRPFGVYGPSIPDTIVSKLTNQALHNKPLTLYVPEQRKRTFLYEEDFLDCLDRLVQALLRGQSGLYNVGSEEVVSVARLADSIYQLLNKTAQPAPTKLIKKDYFIDFWKVPNITRVKAVTKWRPRTSIRSGIWRNLGLLGSETGSGSL